MPRDVNVKGIARLTVHLLKIDPKFIFDFKEKSFLPPKDDFLEFFQQTHFCKIFENFIKALKLVCQGKQKV